ETVHAVPKEDRPRENRLAPARGKKTRIGLPMRRSVTREHATSAELTLTILFKRSSHNIEPAAAPKEGGGRAECMVIFARHRAFCPASARSGHLSRSAKICAICGSHPQAEPTDPRIVSLTQPTDPQIAQIFADLLWSLPFKPAAKNRNRC